MIRLRNLKSEIESLERSGRFDAAWYAVEYPDVLLSGMKPVEHYVRYGEKLGRFPGPPRNEAARPPGRAAAGAGRSVFDAVLRDLLGRSGDRDFARYAAESEQRLRGLRLPPSATLVSVIMPTRDRAYVIGEAIASVCAQTHANWELLVCDDGSRDATDGVIARASDPRIRHLRLAQGGAAKARNHGLHLARGEIVAYLDSDNLWHPRYLELVVARFDRAPGVCATRAGYAEVALEGEIAHVNGYRLKEYSYDRLCSANLIDLNTFAHRRSVFELFGGFNEDLARLQDWDLVLRYLHFQDPAAIDGLMAIYRRNRDWGQITYDQADERSCEQAVARAVGAHYASGVPIRSGVELPSATVLSWDVSRNHFSKAYNLCEAVAAERKIELAGFRFFEDPIFPPYAGAQPAFPMKVYPGGSFPGWLGEMKRALHELDGDVIYAVKPRLPSLGLALLANHRFRKPIVLEINDLESAAAAPQRGEPPLRIDPRQVDPSDPALRNPHDRLWSLLLETLAADVPVRVTHNHALDARFGSGTFFIRNPKDERHFDPARHDRQAARARLGAGKHEQLVLFSGLLREHKGVMELLKLVNGAQSDERRLVFVASRDSAELDHIRQAAHPRVTVLPAIDRNEIAAVTAAADAVVLWLDPQFAASRYQMPFKLTDALAMEVPVIANAIGDLGALGRQGYLRLVPFGDIGRLSSALDELRSDPAAARARAKAGRRLYLRQFSYAAVRANFALAVAAASKLEGVYPAAERFAGFFAAFCDAQCGGARGLE